MRKRLTLVLGGIRAGKSIYAQNLATRGERVLFLATAQPGDTEMEARIRAHQQSRPADWYTLEEPIDPVGALVPVLKHYDTVLLDCLTMWISNLLLASRDGGPADMDIAAKVHSLLELYEAHEVSLIVVSNEVGLGLVPDTELGRLYADWLGRANQIMASRADEVYFVAAGLPLKLKDLTSAGDARQGTDDSSRKLGERGPTLSSL